MIRVLSTAELGEGAAEDRSMAWAHVSSVGSLDLRDTRDEILALVRRHPDILVRTCRPGHLTGSACVVDPARERILLLHHAKLRKWLQPGGHADGDANLARVALREATEETGIADLRIVLPAVDLDIHEVSPPTEDAHVHLDVRFLALAAPGARVVGNHESTELRWVTLDELISLSPDTGLVRLATRALSLSRSLTDLGV